MLNNITAVNNVSNCKLNKTYFRTILIVFCSQPGMPIFLVWAYHPSVDAQPSSFRQHPNDARGVMQQTLIPAAITPTPTPGRNVHSRKEKPTENLIIKNYVKSQQGINSQANCFYNL